MSQGIPRDLIPATVRPMAERDIDVCFTGTIIPTRSKDDHDAFAELAYNPVRREIYERLVKMKGRYRMYVLDGMVPGRNTGNCSSAPALSSCTESFGCETYRHNDVAASGAVPLVNWMYATNYLPFEPDVHAIYFSMIGQDFERTVDRALADPGKLAQIAQAARELVVHHKQRQHIGEHIIRETLAEAGKIRAASSQ